MKLSLHALRRYAGYALALSVILIALVLSVARFWVLPRAASQRPELERQIGQLIDESVTIGSVSARLRGFHPELVLGDFRIVDARGRAGIRFETVRVGIHPLESLVKRRIAPMWVKIHGTRLSVRRRQDGSLAVLGLNVLDHPPAWLLAAERIELIDSHIDWQDELRGRPPVDLGRADLHLANAGERHQLSISIRSPGGEENRLKVRADLVGDLFQRDQWGGRIFLEDARLSAARLNGLFPGVSRLQSGFAGFRVWSDWVAGRMTRLAGRIELRQPTVALADAPGVHTNLRLTGMESWFRWRESETTSLLELKGLRLSSKSGAEGPASQVTLGLERDDTGQIKSWRATASRLRLGDLAAVSDALPMLSDAARGFIRDGSPQGEMHDLNVVYRTDSGSGRRFAFCGEVWGVSVKASKSLPGLSRVGGRICGSDSAGSLDLRSANSELDAPMLWRSAIGVERAELVARWNRVGNSLRIESGGFSVATADFSARGSGTVELADDSATSPLLDLKVTASEFGVLGLNRYLPDALFPETSRYLASALMGGRIERADVLVHGPISEFPFDDHQGVFEAVLDFRKLDVLYHPRWPPLQGIDARLRLSGSRVDFDVDAGRTGNGEITKLKGSVPSLTQGSWLTLDGTVRASAVDTMDFMTRTPLRGIPEGLLQFGVLTGNVEIGLGLTVPLDGTSGDVRVTGSAALKDAAIAFKHGGVSLGPLGGDLTFTESSLKTLNLSGVFLSEPVTITAAGKGEGFEISAEGQARTSTLAGVFRSDIWRLLQGDGAYRLSVAVPSFSESARPSATWNFRSDLRGVQVHLPEPLGKAAATPAVLELSGGFESGNGVPVRLSYDERLQGALVWSSAASGWRLDRGDFAWGCDLPEGGLSDGLKFVGRFSRFDASEWERFFQEFGSVEDTRGWQWKQLTADFEARELFWSGRNLGGFKLTLAKEPSRWKGRIDGDLAAGSFSLQSGRNGYPSLHLDLDRLLIPRRIGGKGTAEKIAALDSRTLPSVYVRSRKVLWRDVDLGTLTLDAERQSLGLMLRKGELSGDRHRLRFAGDWLASAGRSRMRINGQATADSLGNLAGRLGAGTKIQDTRSSVDFQLSWPGSPLDVPLSALEGEVAIRMEEGALLEFDPGWGRMIGFLNLNSIWRRINLDFRDLVNQGLAYDRIEGTFRIGEGKAITSGFLIDGVATRIVIDGSADLTTETLNQIVTVIPRTSVALPIAGTLAGGPAVGAAIFVAQELVGEHVDSITATRYRATGPWDNPTLQKVDGNMPMELLGRAWSGLKRLSGSEREVEEQRK